MKPPPKPNPPNHLSDVPSHTVHHQCWGILTYNSSQAAAEEPPLCIGITNKLTKFLKPDELARNRASHKKNIANAILNNQDPDLDVAVQGFKFKAFGSTEYHQLKSEDSAGQIKIRSLIFSSNLKPRAMASLLSMKCALH